MKHLMGRKKSGTVVAHQKSSSLAFMRGPGFNPEHPKNRRKGFTDGAAKQSLLTKASILIWFFEKNLKDKLF